MTKKRKKSLVNSQKSNTFALAKTK